MSLQTLSLLKEWFPLRDDCSWVLGTVVATRGPVYRKAGAIMLFGGDGQQLGLLSGGCLEADIALNARKVEHRQQAMTLTYDGSDEDDIAYQLGIGCGGSIDLLLQPVTSDNAYLHLPSVHEALQERRTVTLCHSLPGSTGGSDAYLLGAAVDYPAGLQALNELSHPQLAELDGQQWFINPLRPPPKLLVVGGGIDARPVVEMAATLGWHVIVCDPRPANARAEHFPGAAHIGKCQPDTLLHSGQLADLDAAILMSHKLSLDAAALAVLQHTQARYIALLGPKERRDRVLDIAQLSVADLPAPLAGPAGLQLGGDLPEGIALSILAECHAKLHGQRAESISGVL